MAKQNLYSVVCSRFSKAVPYILSAALLAGNVSYADNDILKSNSRIDKRISAHNEKKQTERYFKEKYSLTPPLASFLAGKNTIITVKKEPGMASLDIGYGASMEANGVYKPHPNTIDLKKPYLPGTLYHEIGHSLWDTVGDDGIFESKQYSGPSREDFISLLKSSQEYEIQKKDMQLRASTEIYSRLIQKFRKTEQEDTIKQFHASKGCTADSFLSWKEYSEKTAGITYDGEMLEKRIIHETFAESFSKWTQHQETPLAPLFSSMLYDKMPLRETIIVED